MCSDVFWGYKLGTLAINGLIRIYFSLDYNIMDIKFSIEKVCSVVLLSRTLSSYVKLCKYEYWTEKESFIKMEFSSNASFNITNSRVVSSRTTFGLLDSDKEGNVLRYCINSTSSQFLFNRYPGLLIWQHYLDYRMDNQK